MIAIFLKPNVTVLRAYLVEKEESQLSGTLTNICLKSINFFHHDKTETA